MGQSIFGGSKQKSESGNHAYDFIQQNYGQSGADAFNGGTNMLGDILGLSGDPAKGQAALDNYWKSAGGEFQLGEGLDALTSKFSSMGLRQSGAAAKGMEQYRQGLVSTYLNNYLGQLGDFAKIGLGAGGLVSDAGQYSKGSGSSSPGIAKFIGTLISAGAMASDRRLKTNIAKVHEASDGLGVYDWNWKADPNGQTVRGVIADEVEKLRPQAFVKGFVGGVYDGVNYSALGSLA